MIKLVKMYSVVFNDYTNSSQNTVRGNRNSDPEYLTVRMSGVDTAYIIPEHQIQNAMEYGNGIRSLTLVGVMTVSFDDPETEIISDNPGLPGV